MQVELCGVYFRFARPHEVKDEDGYFHGYVCKMHDGIELDKSRPLFSVEALQTFLQKMDIPDTGSFVETARKLKLPERMTEHDLMYDETREIVDTAEEIKVASMVTKQDFINFLFGELSSKEQVTMNLFGKANTASA